ncbi:phage tail tape measure protein [Sporolactobacillus terrae]|uniref:phage tail tape measure protein n=1 Tax=Sporolactobacillus terrae TaxID=269673 RepID=UPI0006869726|nr:phage tail tape measure protein [Sporolactobacillus terrae]
MALVSELQARFTASAAQMQTTIHALRKEVEDLGATTEKTNSRAGNSTGKQVSAWERLSSKLTDVQKRYGAVQDAGGKMAKVFGIATAAIGSGLVYATKTAMDFDAKMSKVGAMAGSNRQEFGKLRESAIKLGASTSLSASQAAEAMSEMAKNGFNANQIIAAMPGVISAAEASGEDLALVSDTVSTAINAFGLSAKDASHIADVLTMAANDSAAGIQDMTYTFKYAAAPAHALGYSMEELSAATMVMANSGIRGEQAGTSLRAALLRMVDPPKDASKELKKLGVTITDSHGKMRPFATIMGDLSKKTDGMSKAQKTAALSTIFGTEAVSGMLPVVEAGSKKLNAMTKELKDSDGASAKAAKQMKNNLKGSVDQLQGAVESAAITVGENLTPTIQDMTKKVQAAVEWYNNLSPEMQQFIVKAAATTTAVLAVGTGLGAMTWAIGGLVKNTAGAIQAGSKFINYLRDLNKAAGVAGAAGGLAQTASKAGGLAGALPLLTNPIGLTITALAALGIGAGVVWHQMNKIESTSTAAADAIGEQRAELDPIIKKYDDLQAQSKLTSDEFGKFIDIQARLKKETSEKEIAKLKDEADQLQKKSGLSNKQLSEMLDLNGKLIEKVPGATDKITDQGNRIAESTDKAKKYNAALLEQQLRELEIARNNALGNEEKYKKRIKDLQDQLNVGLGTERGLQKLNEEAIANGWKATIKKYEAQRDNVHASESERAVATYNLSLLRNHGELLNTNLGKQQKINDKTQEKLDKDKQQLNRADQLNAKIASVLLKSVGINDQGRKGISILAGQVEKEKNKLSEINKAYASGKLNTAEYNKQKSATQGVIDKLIGVGNKIKGATNGAYDLNKELRKDIKKDINTKTHKDNNYYDLDDTIKKLVNTKTNKDGNYHDLPKGVRKNVNAKTNKDANYFDLGKTISKIINVKTWFSKHAAGVKDLPRDEVALVGEAGREFVNDKRIGTYLVDKPSIVPLSAGSSVLKNSETERLGKLLGLPGFATGVGNGFSGVKEIMNHLQDRISNLSLPSINPIRQLTLPSEFSTPTIVNRSSSKSDNSRVVNVNLNIKNYNDETGKGPKQLSRELGLYIKEEVGFK